MRQIFCILLCVLLLTSCAQKPEITETIPPVPSAPSNTEPVYLDPHEMLAVSVPASSEHIYLEDGTELCTFTKQHMQLLLQNEAVADRIILEFLNRVDSMQQNIDGILTAAQENYDPATSWYPYFQHILYSPERIDHGVLSLSGIQSSYNGGIHGNVTGISVSYDLSSGDVLTLGSILHMDADKEDIIRMVLNKLESISEDSYFFEGYEDTVRSRLGGDENQYQDFYFTQLGLVFYFSPYEIAPYASGIITVELPYHELIGVLYDGYFPDEQEETVGSVCTDDFMEVDMEQFSCMEEVTVDAGETLAVVYPEGTISEIRVKYAGDGISLPEYTLFAAMEMSEENAVILGVSKDYISNLSICYRSNGEMIETQFE